MIWHTCMHAGTTTKNNHQQCLQPKSRNSPLHKLTYVTSLTNKTPNTRFRLLLIPKTSEAKYYNYKPRISELMFESPYFALLTYYLSYNTDFLLFYKLQAGGRYRFRRAYLFLFTHTIYDINSRKGRSFATGVILISFLFIMTTFYCFFSCLASLA